jgi:hypothetical protein
MNCSDPGRVGIIRLLPLPMRELFCQDIATRQYEEYIYTGFFSRLHSTPLEPGGDGGVGKCQDRISVCKEGKSVVRYP